MISASVLGTGTRVLSPIGEQLNFLRIRHNTGDDVPDSAEAPGAGKQTVRYYGDHVHHHFHAAYPGLRLRFYQLVTTFYFWLGVLSELVLPGIALLCVVVGNVLFFLGYFNPKHTATVAVAEPKKLENSSSGDADADSDSHCSSELRPGHHTEDSVRLFRPAFSIGVTLLFVFDCLFTAVLFAISG